MHLFGLTLIPMTTVTELKDAGSAAFKEKNYESAISLWSDALSKKGCDVEMERSLLSNRSYAFMHSGNLRAALLDADKCIATDKSWVKGHLRKAEVCYRMAKFADSVSAYDAAFKVPPCTHLHIHTYVHTFSMYLSLSLTLTLTLTLTHYPPCVCVHDVYTTSVTLVPRPRTARATARRRGAWPPARHTAAPIRPAPGGPQCCPPLHSGGSPAKYVMHMIHMLISYADFI